jgi:hypothetical protein
LVQLRRDHPVDMATHLRHVSRDDVIIGIRNDAELEPLRLELVRGPTTSGKGGILEMLEINSLMSAGAYERPSSSIAIRKA